MTKLTYEELERKVAQLECLTAEHREKESKIQSVNAKGVAFCYKPDHFALSFSEITKNNPLEIRPQKDAPTCQQVVDAMQEGVIIFSSPTELLSMNPAAQRILGYSPAELQHRLGDDSAWRISYDEGPACTLEDNPVVRCFATGNPEKGSIFKIFHPQQGRDIWIITNVTPLFSGQRTTPCQVIATFANFSDRTELRESRKTQLFLLENIHSWSLPELLRHIIDKVGALTGSPIGFYHFVNEKQGVLTRQMWFSRDSEPSGQNNTMTESSPLPEPTGAWLDCLRQRRTVVHNNAPAVAQQEGRSDDQNNRMEVGRYLVTPIFRDNTIIAILGFGNKACEYSEEDISLVQHFADLSWNLVEQKQLEEQRRESQQQLLTILDSIEAQIFVADMDTHEILFINRRMKELFGEGVLQAPCYRSFQKQDVPCDFCTNDRLLDAEGKPGPVCQWEHSNLVTGRWYVNYDRAVRWINGKIVRMQVAFDNTDRKETELKLLQMQKMEAIGLLAGGVAHDFNNILSVILGYATMALDELGEKHLRVKRDILQIRKAGLRARDLSKQILTFSHQSEENFQLLKLPLVIKEVMKMLRSSFPSTIRIMTRISLIEQRILADPSQIHQVLMNLCTNALHAMKEGGELTIALVQVHLEEGQRCRQLQDLPAGSYLKLSVSDTGKGIPEAIQEKIFDPFFTTKIAGEGTGLGLAVVQGIVNNHKGAVTVDSAPGTGTTFSVYLPEAAFEPMEAEADEKEELRGGTETILVVDDEPAVAMIIQRLLQTLGYTSEAFTDSAKAFEVFTRDPTIFDLVITDMTMPKFTGITLARAMLAIRPQQPIILCTGYSDAIDEAGAKAEGIRAFLDKPVSLETLAAAVRRTLDQDKEESPSAF